MSQEKSTENAAANANKARSDAARKRSLAYDGRGRVWECDAAERLKVSRKTMQRWRVSCPYLPNRRGINHWPKNHSPGVRVYVANTDIKRIEQKINGNAKAAAVSRLRPLRQKSIASARKKRRANLKAEGEGSAYDAATWAGVGISVIYRAFEIGELESIIGRSIAIRARRS